MHRPSCTKSSIEILSMHPIKNVLSVLRRVSPFPFLLALLASCGQGETSMMGFENIAQGMTSGITSDRLEAIREQVNWSDFWKSHAGAGSEVPSVNFVSETVIVVLLGRQPSAPLMDNAVNITSVENERGAKLVVHYDVLVPSSGCFNNDLSASQPHHIIKIPRNDKDPVFIRTERKFNCT